MYSVIPLRLLIVLNMGHKALRIGGSALGVIKSYLLNCTQSIIIVKNGNRLCSEWNEITYGVCSGTWTIASHVPYIFAENMLLTSAKSGYANCSRCAGQYEK